MVAGLTHVFPMVPLSGYASAQCLQGVACASKVPSTDGTACLHVASSAGRPCRPAVLLPYRALGAEPLDLLAASQPCAIWKVVISCIAPVIPLCQESCHFRILALCKGWVLGLLGPCSLSALRATSQVKWGNSSINSCSPLVATSVTEPSNSLTTACYYIIRSTIICLIVPLCCNCRSYGSQRLVLAHFLAFALGTTSASCSIVDTCFPAVQVPIWTLITCPPNLSVAPWFDVYVAQVSIGSMVKLLL